MSLRWSSEKRAFAPFVEPKRRKWHKMLIRPQQLNLKPKKNVKREWCGSLAYCTLYDNTVNQDEVYHIEDRLDKGDSNLDYSTIQLIQISNPEEENPKRKNNSPTENDPIPEDKAIIDHHTTEDNDDDDVFSVAESVEDFKDIAENEYYWSCDEEELEVYSPFEDSDDEVDYENGESMRLSEGETIIHRVKNVENLKRFLYLGYYVDTRDSYNETPLHQAIRIRDLELTKALIAAGANVNAINANGQTPLIIAVCNRSYLEIVQELLNAGSDYSTVMNYFKEGVMHCAWTGELVREFWYRGAKIDPKDKYGYTPLHRASRNSYFKSPLSAAQELIRLGADVNCRDDNGKTPLYHAILGRRWDVMVELISNGAELSEVISDRSFPNGVCTALDKALRHERIMGQVLIKHVLFQNWARERDFTSIQKYVLNSYNTDYVDGYTNKCIGELTLMKKHMIGNYSLLDVIKSQMVYKKNKPLYIDYDVDAEMISLFPTYCDLISKVINEVKKKADCLTKLKQMNVSLCSKDMYTQRSVILNYHCILMICEYLSGEELSVFLSACS